MGHYFVNPYNMYYEKLNAASNIVSSATTLSQDAASVTDALSNLYSFLSNSEWGELGYNELINTSIPGLKTRSVILNNNISTKLVSVCNEAIGNLVPTLKDLKDNDDMYSSALSELNLLSEPQEKYDSFHQKSAAYKAYEAKKSELTSKVSECEKKCQELKVKADEIITKIKSFDDSLEDFSTMSASGGEIFELEGLILTKEEEAFEKAFQKEAESTELQEQDVEKVDTSTYSTGETILYNDAGGYKDGYSRKILTSHGKMVTVFCQVWRKAIRYTDIKNDPKTLCSAGCGYNALATILSSKYPDITPEEIFVDMGKKSLFANNIKNYLQNKYGIKVGNRSDFTDGKDKKNKIVEAVKRGNMAICTVDARYDTKYTKQGHWVSIVDYNPKTDEFYITDSNDQDDSNAAPIDAQHFIDHYEINTNIIYIADA